MAGFQQTQDDDIVASINVTPLVDIVLVLLVVFMVTAKLITQQGVPMDLPKAASAGATQAVLVVSLDDHGTMFADGRKLANDRELRSVATQANKKTPSSGPCSRPRAALVTPRSCTSSTSSARAVSPASHSLSTRLPPTRAEGESDVQRLDPNLTVAAAPQRCRHARWGLAIAIALGAHGALALGLPDQEPARRPPTIITEVELAPPPAPKPPLPEPAPAPERDSAPTPTKAADNARPMAKAAPAARAGNVLVAKSDAPTPANAEPVDFVTDPNGTSYAGGVVARGGTGDHGSRGTGIGTRGRRPRRPRGRCGAEERHHGPLRT